MTASRPDATLPIDVQGELRLEGAAGDAITLAADGALLRLSASRWASLRGLGPRSLLAQRRALARSIDALKTLRLAVDVDIAGRRAFGLGDGVKTTLLARLLGLDSTDIRFSNVVSLLRSRGATPGADPR